jgi:hypothetical protein
MTTIRPRFVSVPFQRQPLTGFVSPTGVLGDVKHSIAPEKKALSAWNLGAERARKCLSNYRGLGFLRFIQLGNDRQRLDVLSMRAKGAELARF